MIKRQRSILYILIGIGVLFSIHFITWFVSKERIGWWPLYTLISISVGYRLLKVFFEWYHYLGIRNPPVPPPVTRSWKVDMLTTAMPGEPLEMIQQTLTAMVNVRYPHTSYLCDEGNDPILKQLCADLGVVHITRTVKQDAKAGNINNALQQATGEICVILDPDHVPEPDFLDVVLPYFERDEVGFVQIVQAYKNANESWIARGAAQQTYTFYGPLMQGMHNYGTAQAIGANCTFRRAALDSIGGHAAGLSEDMHTAMQLHAKGWKSVYIPRILARGLVPATTNAYFKQQLKWSRGTFELLFRVYWKLAGRFSWRQKLHYFLIPLHFAVGVITLIDISIPITALFTGRAPLYFHPFELVTTLLPLALIVLTSRLYAQKWMIEEHEKGFHLVGGLLLFGTWWTHLKGFVYSILSIRVPYIPTPKKDRHTNNLEEHTPNFIILGLTVMSILYGRYTDWNPYAQFMAAMAIVNAGMLILFIIASQQLLTESLRNHFSSLGLTKPFYRTIEIIRNRFFPPFYRLISEGAPIFGFLAITFFFVYSTSPGLRLTGEQKKSKLQSGGFYAGLYMPSVQQLNTTEPARQFIRRMGTEGQIHSLYLQWGPDSAGQFPTKLARDIIQEGGIPMITWEPWVSRFPEREDAPWLRFEKKGMQAIGEGKFDDYIRSFADQVRNFGKPVFIRFAHECDNPIYPWSAKGENTPEEYIGAWKKLVAVFTEAGAMNVTWVWTPWDPETMNKFYPGDQFVDWIGLTALNFGHASDNGKWRSFEEIYTPFRKLISRYEKPVMLAEFGSTSYGGDKKEWLQQSMRKIRLDFPEIKAVVLFNSDRDKAWITNWRPEHQPVAIEWALKSADILPAGLAGNAHWMRSANVSNQPSGSGKALPKPIRKDGEKYQWIVDGKPFYVKGIAYNPGHSWQDGFNPLTRLTVEKDLQAIREMGANTIRRYHPTGYDRTLLKVAEEKELKIIYGFWFDPKTDYYADASKISEYVHLVESTVRKFKGNKSVIAWNIGNETSGLLKHHFNQPYLFQVRKSYAEMIEGLARRIHELDPGRPVLTTLEHSWQLAGDLAMFHKYAPSLDLIGVNSYYTEQLSRLHEICASAFPGKPYLVTEFGPKGYWNDLYSDYDSKGFLDEATAAQKGDLYTSEWKNFIAGHAGWNLGGVAFCWQDRYEGTATWFGMTDYKGRKKPLYYDLKSLWSGQQSPASYRGLHIIGPEFRVNPGQTYEFTVINPNANFTQYEWVLFGESHFRGFTGVISSDSRKKVKIRIPDRPDNYRLYVYASDGTGNVLTASKVIALQGGIINKGL